MTKRAKVLRDDELEALQRPFRDGSASSRRVLLALHLGVGCGLRSQEIAGCRWSDLDLEDGRIYVRPSIAKGGRTRSWFLAAPTVRLLKAYREQLGEIAADSPLFPSRKGGDCVTASHMREIIKGAFRTAGIARPGLSSHALRHTFAVQIYQHSRDLELCRRALGHARVSTTQTYLAGLGELLDYRPEIEAALTYLAHLFSGGK